MTFLTFLLVSVVITWVAVFGLFPAIAMTIAILALGLLFVVWGLKKTFRQ